MGSTWKQKDKPMYVLLPFLSCALAIPIREGVQRNIDTTLPPAEAARTTLVTDSVSKFFRPEMTCRICDSEHGQPLVLKVTSNGRTFNAVFCWKGWRTTFGETGPWAAHRRLATFDARCIIGKGAKAPTEEIWKMANRTQSFIVTDCIGARRSRSRGLCNFPPGGQSGSRSRPCRRETEYAGPAFNMISGARRARRTNTVMAAAIKPMPNAAMQESCTSLNYAHRRIGVFFVVGPAQGCMTVKTWEFPSQFSNQPRGYGHTTRAPPGVSLPSGSRTRNLRILDLAYKPLRWSGDSDSDSKVPVPAP
jgi:hypothetical protein